MGYDKPCDPAIEQVTLQEIVGNPDAYLEAMPRLPDPGIFYHAGYRAVFTALSHLYRRHEPIELITVCNELIRLEMYEQAGQKEGVEALFTATRNGSNLKGWINSLLDYYARRKEQDLAQLIEQNSWDRNKEIAGRIESVKLQLQEIQRLATGDAPALGKKEFGDFYINLTERRFQEKDQPKLTFPWHELRRFRSQIAKGELIGVLGEPGAGKTAFMEQIGESWWKQGFVGGYYHLETSKETMADRRVARWTGIPLERLEAAHKEEKTGNYEYLTSDEYNSMYQALAMFDTWPGDLQLIHCPGWTMPQICADIVKRVETEGWRFVILDYLNKVQVVPFSGNGNLTFDIGAGIELFKTTLEEYGLVGMMGAQMTKDAKKRKRGQTLADVRNTGELDDKAQIGVLLKRPRDDDNGRAGPCNISIVKANSGREGTTGMWFDGPRYRFMSL